MTEELTIKKYGFWPNEAQPEYGLMFCEDGEGKRCTLRGDVGLVKAARTANVTEFGDGLLSEADWERRDGWLDEPGEVAVDYVKNSSGQYVAIRDDGLLMRAVESEDKVEEGWHLMTDVEYDVLIEAVSESELDPAHRRASAG